MYRWKIVQTIQDVIVSNAINVRSSDGRIHGKGTL